MNKLPKKPRCEDMYAAILSLRSVEECMQFFDDLCSVKELMALEQRFQVAKDLYMGKKYTEILAETGVSSATVSRVNRTLQCGNGGYETVFSRMQEKDT